MKAMATTESLLRRADGGVFTIIEIDRHRVPVVDLRLRADVPALEPFALRLRDQMREPDNHPQIQLILLALPQPSDSVALNLARQGIQLLTGSAAAPVSTILDRFQRSWADASRTPPPPLPARRGNLDVRVFSQPPPGFDPARFEERMRLLERPWQEDTDRRESDY
jgi:hypothetical protein